MAYASAQHIVFPAPQAMREVAATAVTLYVMEPSLVLSALSLVVATGGLLWNRHTWQSARKSDVRVMASQDASGLDIFDADSVKGEHVIRLRAFNHGEQSEYVMWTGLESVAGEPLADDRPTSPKLVDDPPPTPHELPPRGQFVAQFKVHADAAADGFVGYAVLGTGQRVYSVPAMPDPGLADIESDIMKIVSEVQADEDPQ